MCSNERPALVVVALEVLDRCEDVAASARPSEPLLELDEALSKGVLGERLERVVERGLDLEAALEHPLRAEPFLDRAAHLLDEICCGHVAVVVRRHIERHLARRLVGRFRDVLLLQHP